MTAFNRTGASGWMRAGAVAAMLATAAGSASAARLDGATFAPTLTYYDRQLTLAGCGMREFLWTNLYAVSLFLPRRNLNLPAILSPDTAKAFSMTVVWDGSLPDDIPAEWRDDFRTQVRRELARAVKEVYRDLETGDTVTVAYAPEHGTTLSHNGAMVLHEPGHALMNAFLGVWLGQQPVSDNLRRLLLSGECP